MTRSPKKYREIYKFKMKWLKPDQNENYPIKFNTSNSLHQSIAFTLILGQCFGLMPVNGITGSSEKSVYFTWKSWRVAYCIIVIISILFPIYMTIQGAVFYESSLSTITTLVFFGSSLIVHLLFFNLAKNWANLIRSWYVIEVAMRNYGRAPKLSTRLKLMTIITLLLAAIEHFLVTIHNLIIANRCKTGDQDLFEYFYAVISFPQVFKSMRYYTWAGALLQFVNFISTFSWTYIDLFIMLMSSSLSLRFQQITAKVELYVQTKVSNEYMWRCLREDYNRLSKLCQKLNNSISYIVLVSFGSNLFFILIQFFNSLRTMEYILEKVYFFFSFGFLIGRTISVSLYGAWINDESRKPLQYLNSASSSVYNVEIRRFILHVGFDSACLTGKRFFNVTRRVILSIAGTIVAYELVLIQFYGTILYRSKQKLTNNTFC